MIQIDKNIPIPKRVGKTIYPWKILKIGESFVYQTTNPYRAVMVANQRLAPKHFICKTRDGVSRIWRTA